VFAQRRRIGDEGVTTGVSAQAGRISAKNTEIRALLRCGFMQPPLDCGRISGFLRMNINKRRIMCARQHDPVNAPLSSWTSAG
jgi:hypothetical protein